MGMCLIVTGISLASIKGAFKYHKVLFLGCITRISTWSYINLNFEISLVQLTDLCGHFVEFLLRSAHEHHIQTSLSKLVNNNNNNTTTTTCWSDHKGDLLSNIPPMHTPFLYPLMLLSPLRKNREFQLFKHFWSSGKILFHGEL